MTEIVDHPAYQATRRCLALVPDAVLFEAVTYEMDMDTAYTDPECPVCLVGTLLRCADPVGHPNGVMYCVTASVLFLGTRQPDWCEVFFGIVNPRKAPAIEAALADELLSRV